MLIIEKDILALGEGLIQGLDGTMITPEVKYCINFAKARRRLVLVCIMMEAIVCLFVDNVKMQQFKAKDLQIKPYPVCLGNVLKNFTIKNMRKTWLNGY